MIAADSIPESDIIQALLQAKRTMRLLSDCNAVLIRSVDESEMLKQICQLVVDVGGYRLVWIGYAEQDAGKRVVPVAHSGATPEYIKHLNITWADTERGRGPTGKAIRSGQTQIARDILLDPHFTPWRANAMLHGLFSSIALPLQENGQIFGALNIYAQDTSSFDREEVLLLEELTGNLAHGISVARLRTAHRKVVDQRRKQERLCRAIVEQSADGIAITRLDGTILTVNPASCRITGYSEEELRQRTLCDLATPDTQPLLLSLAANNQSGSRELDMVRKDGSRFPAEMRAYPITLPDEQGEEQAVLGVIVDITQRRQEILEKHLLQQQATQNAHLATVGVMAAGIVHEVNNPNHAISFNSHLLANAWKDVAIILHEYYQEHGEFSLGGLPYSEMRDTVPSLIDGIIEYSARINNIIKNMQYVSRKEQAAVVERVDLLEVCSRACTLLKNQISQRTRHFTTALPDSVPAVWGNSQQLEQVLVNVIMNALQALTDMEQAVQLQLLTKAEGDRIWITVRDEGVGIATEHLPRLTKPFFSTKLAEGGSGLGLFISNRIVESHGGEMHFVSKPKEGTCVTIRLPIMEESAVSQPLPE
ncbi:MAG: PAS domain S-box protein [Magnetococcus sp. MYC-9]